MQLIDSPRRCRADGKRMVMDMGAHEDEGDLEITHTCLHCGRTETQRPEYDRPASGPSLLASIRDKIRNPDKPMPPPAAFEPYIEEAR